MFGYTGDWCCSKFCELFIFYYYYYSVLLKIYGLKITPTADVGRLDLYHTNTTANSDDVLINMTR